MASIRFEDGHAAAARIGDPDRTIGRDLKAIRNPAFLELGEDALRSYGTVGVHVVDAHMLAARVGVIEPLAIRGETDAVRQDDAVGENACRSVEVDDEKIAGLQLAVT